MDVYCAIKNMLSCYRVFPYDFNFFHWYLKLRKPHVYINSLRVIASSFQSVFMRHIKHLTREHYLQQFCLFVIYLQRLPHTNGFLEAAIAALPLWRKVLASFPAVPWPSFVDYIRAKVNLLASEGHLKELMCQLQLVGEVFTHH